MLASTVSDGAGRTRVAARLQTMLLGGRSRRKNVDVVADTDIESATGDEMFELIDRELGGL